MNDVVVLCKREGRSDAGIEFVKERKQQRKSVVAIDRSTLSINKSGVDVTVRLHQSRWGRVVGIGSKDVAT